MGRMQRALLSVSHKEGIVEFAKGLYDLGMELLSTGGTAHLLQTAGIPVVAVSDYTGFPEILDGRVKTLHPRIHGGILAKRDDAIHQSALAAHGIAPIDVVAVNLYPFADVIARPEVSREEAFEHIDIGGPTLVRAAAKNYQGVAVLVDPADYPRVLEELRVNGDVRPETRWRLAQKAFCHTAQYDAIIAAYLVQDQSPWTLPATSTEAGFPETLTLTFAKMQELRYGENPHQPAAFYRDLLGRGLSLAQAQQLQGKALSYTNLLDVNAALGLILEFPDAPACCIIKHTNPCGVGIGDTAVEAFERARACDPVSAYGGIIGVNRPLDGAFVQALKGLLVEAIIAPAVTQEALAALRRRENLRLLALPGLESAPPPYELRSVMGGLLVQGRDGESWDAAQVRVVSRRQPTQEEWQSLSFAWRVCKHVKSNAIVLARQGQTVGIGAGQMSRVDAVRLAATKAQLPTPGTVLASDAFFPFRDGIDEAAKIGVTAVAHPGGSIRDEEVRQAGDEHGMAMVLTGMRHFKH
ncbi:MAG TPA: bifunctional phosphoribosylaminoimidazolecarboxamide formyltransferase/IMP cyclohydrolase [Alphaproteobacteria bacterium]|nr:bifunctional phosphoribosylaminoimidazolecarboxamide formyltransferase/IMP cyclohydrolase [Alphaproteobacteria bacterium]